MLFHSRCGVQRLWQVHVPDVGALHVMSRMVLWCGASTRPGSFLLQPHDTTPPRRTRTYKKSSCMRRPCTCARARLTCCAMVLQAAMLEAAAHHPHTCLIVLGCHTRHAQTAITCSQDLEFKTAVWPKHRTSAHRLSHDASLHVLVRLIQRATDYAVIAQLHKQCAPRQRQQQTR